MDCDLFQGISDPNKKEYFKELFYWALEGIFTHTFKTPYEMDLATYLPFSSQFNH